MPTPVPAAEPPGRLALTRAQRWLFAAGYAILVAGSAASVWVYRNARQDELADELRARAYDTKKVQDELERYGGKANVLATDIDQWFAGLWHGRNLAYTLAVLTLALALAAFFLALFLPDFPAEERGPGGSGAAKR